MANLRTGKIFKIMSNQTDKVYIGSTEKEKLPNINHMLKYKIENDKSSKGEMLKYDDAKAVLLEEIQFNEIDELHARIRYYLSIYKTVNRVIPGASKARRKVKMAKKKALSNAKQKEIREFDELWANMDENEEI